METKADVSTTKSELLDSVMAAEFIGKIPHSTSTTSASWKLAPP